MKKYFTIEEIEAGLDAHCAAVVEHIRKTKDFRDPRTGVIDFVAKGEHLAEVERGLNNIKAALKSFLEKIPDDETETGTIIEG